MNTTDRPGAHLTAPADADGAYFFPGLQAPHFLAAPHFALAAQPFFAAAQHPLAFEALGAHAPHFFWAYDVVGALATATGRATAAPSNALASLRM